MYRLPFSTHPNLNHEAAHRWFGETGRQSWATCPITENGFIGVLSHPSNPSVQATPNEVADRLSAFAGQRGHVFWPDDVSLLTGLDAVSRARLVGSQQVTDFYLVALAHHHAGCLATFDGSFQRTLRGFRTQQILALSSVKEGKNGIRSAAKTQGRSSA